MPSVYEPLSLLETCHTLLLAAQEGRGKKRGKKIQAEDSTHCEAKANISAQSEKEKKRKKEKRAQRWKETDL